MSPAPWTHWKRRCSYSRSGKRRFHEINNTIDCLKTELMLNDIVLKSELDVRFYSDYDRALMAAELYKERLEALANSSRSQIWRVQSGNSPLPAYDFHLDYDSWNPKRMKYSSDEGYFQNSNTYYQDWAINTIKKRRNNPPVKKAVPIKHTTSKTQASVASSKKCTIESKPIESNTAVKPLAPVKSNFVATVKKTVSTNTSCPVTSRNTATTKTEASKSSISVPNTKISNTSAIKGNPTSLEDVATTKKQACNTAAKRVAASTTPNASEPAWSSVKTELNINNENKRIQNIPSLFSCDLSHIKLQFAEADRIVVKYENNLMKPLKNSDGKIKAEPVTDEDAMVDDLADHI